MIRPVTIVANPKSNPLLVRRRKCTLGSFGILIFLIGVCWSSPNSSIAAAPAVCPLTNDYGGWVVAPQDSIPKPREKREPDAAFPTSSRAEKARAAVIVKHTRLGTVPPDSEEARQRREDRQRAAEEKKAAEMAALADRMERRRQRLAELESQRGSLSRHNRRKVNREAKAERKRLAEADKREKAAAAALAKREAEKREREAKRQALLAKRAEEQKQQEARLAREQAKRDALLAKQAEAQRKRDAELARANAERAAERQRTLAKQQAERERRAQAAAAERERLAKTPPQPSASPPPAPQLSPAERTQKEREARALAKEQREVMARLQKEAAAKRKIAQRQARIAYRNARGERKAARQQALRDTRLARAEARRARQQVMAERRSEKNAQKLARQQAKAKLKADRLAKLAARRADREQLKAERMAAREARKSERLAKREVTRSAKLARKAERSAQRDLRRSERLARLEARRNERLARRALRESERLARRSDRMAKRAARRAERLARREARRARRLARREARRLRRLQNPPYWTAEPAIAIGLPMRSGGDDKALEAITVQALAGYHKAKGLSIRGGMAATIINSKVSSESTTTETITQTGVIRIIRNPDGSQTEVTGPIQVQQTTTTTTRYFNSLMSIDLPILAGYRLRGNRFGLTVEAGPSFNLSSGGSAHVRRGDAFQPVGGGYYASRRKGIGFLIMGTGEYRLSQTAALTGGLRIQTLGGAFENPEVTSNTTRASTISISLGYRFKF